MRRREFIAGLSATVTLPLGARAQQPAMPAIGYLGIGTLEEARGNFAAVCRGLAEAGYVEGRNLSVEFRCADYHSEQLPALASDLVQHQVAAIIAPSGPAISAAYAATKSIPIIFFTGFDPVASGFVASLNRPGGNLTGIFTLNPELLAKRLELLHELVPAAKSMALLFSPTGITSTEAVFQKLKERPALLVWSCFSRRQPS
jgi:putative tryptophan/tyrosine transport system substrate-binding protein